MRATSKDVAYEAGVSRATVSYVLNRTPGQTIPEATRRKVLEAASKLGYTPHASARALRSGTSSLVLFVTPELPFSVAIARLVDRLTRGVAELGLSLVTWQRSAEGDFASTLAHLQPRLVVAMVGLDLPEQKLLENADIPVVDFTGREALIPYGLITGQVQVQRLALAGHRRLAIVTTANRALTVFADSRLEGVHRGCHELGLPAPEVLRLDDPDEATVSRISAELSLWRDGPDPVTGICAYNDVYAAACLAAARQIGLEVPAQIAVVGVDDEPMGVFTSPPLTTVRLQMDEVSDAALQQVRELLAGKAIKPRGSSLHVELVPRGSA